MYLVKISFLTCLLISGVISYSQSDTISEIPDTVSIEYFDVFQEVDPIYPEDPLVLFIEMDMKKFYKSKYKDESVPADLTLVLQDSILYTKKIKIKPRGEFRKSHCIFPPIEIKFAKSDTDNIFTEEGNKLKLVTHCKNVSIYEQYVLKEYLCYKMYNLLTDYSFRVRLLEIHYIDKLGKKKPVTKYGFIVESNKSLASRINAYPVKLTGIPLNKTDFDIGNIMAVFQYLIGNPDWVVSALHNVKLYKLIDPLKFDPVPVPYDFDYSGMVNTDYAVPDEKLGITSVRQRVYMGYCIPEEDLRKVLDYYIQNKDHFYALVNNCGLLNNFHKNEMLIYMNEFFEVIENPFRVKTDIESTCKRQ